MDPRNQIVECLDAGTPHHSDVREQTDCFARSFAELWGSTPDEFFPFREKYGTRQQEETEAKVDEALSTLSESEDCAEETALFHVQRVKSSIRDLVVQSMEPDRRDATEEMLGKFSDSGDDFVRRAQKFDSDLTADDVFQALRNLWIINSMQAAFDLPICANSSGIAYSLLYPYTDNYLDDGSVTADEKRAFNAYLSKRLLGIAGPAPSTLASRVSQLVEMIETEYPRGLYPGVYEGLLAIHRSQQLSLQQHEGIGERDRPLILDISVRKGGTSVLADAYLSKGWLTLDEMEFAFGYGVFLQFIDDLQDVGSDLAHGHQTLFSLSATGGLDGMANRLLRFIESVLLRCNLPPTGRVDTLTDLVTRSCRSLVLESIALNPTFYSNGYLEKIESFSPIRFARIREMHTQMREKQRRARKVFKGGRFARALACAEPT